MAGPSSRQCIACGSPHLTLVPRGYAGQTDAPDQYVVCQECGRVTYEIVAVTQREIRLYRYEVNGILSRDGVSYRIRRILKVGFDEYLLYLRPEPEAVAADNAEEPASGESVVSGGS